MSIAKKPLESNDFPAGGHGFPGQPIADPVQVDDLAETALPT